MITEARATLDGAKHAMERNYDRMIIESDSQMAVNLVYVMPMTRTISESRSAFTSSSIVFVGPDANKAAHLCAKQALIGDISRSIITLTFSLILFGVIIIHLITQ
jgi:predicted P-loop ATPase/GTPase